MRNVSDQFGNFLHLFEERAQTVIRATGTQGLDRSLAPALAFALMVSLAESEKNSLRAASRFVFLACGQFFASQTGIEPKSLPFLCEPRFLTRVLRVEPTDDPAFPLDDGQSHDNRDGEFCFSSGLFQSRSPRWLVVLIPNKQHARQIGDCGLKIADGTTCSMGVVLTRLPFKVAHRGDSCIQRQLPDSRPEQAIPAPFSNPGPLVVEQVFFHPIDGLHQHPIREFGRGLEISRSFVHNSEQEPHDPAPLSASHFSPNMLHISPGAISSFHVANFGWSVSRPQREWPSASKAMILTCSGLR